MTSHSWEKHYGVLINKQEECLRLNKAQLERLECCFSESFQATEMLVKETLEKGFKNISEEIHFFKHIKPKFTSYLIYFRLLYHNALFEPNKDDLRGQIEFWKHEVQRLTKYITENREFYAYWKSGCSEKDADYFVMRDTNETSATTTSAGDILYQTKVVPASSHDNQVAIFLALEKYEQFVTKRLESINDQGN